MPPRTASSFAPAPAAALEAGDPDLILTVMQETLADGRRALKFFAKAREPHLNLYFTRFESEPFHGEPHEHFRELFRDIARVPQGCSEDRLAGRGAQLFSELLPEPLQRRLCGLVGAVRTVQILSNEAWIPWELLKLQDPEDPSSSGPFLVEAFSLTRWMSELRFPQTRQLPMSRIALVVPKDSGLQKSGTEAERVKGLGGAEREIVEIPAAFRQLRDALASGHYDGWHFAGHGLVARGGSSLVLEDGEELSPAVLYGPARQLGGCRPLVFLNACHSGRGEPSLTKIDGLAAAFLKAGAGAFIGTNWAVNDEEACWFATELYQHLFSGSEIGEAVRKARLGLRARFPHGNAWLAYSVFADPAARCLPAPLVKPFKKAQKKRVSKPGLSSSSVLPATPSPAPESPRMVIEIPSPEPKQAQEPRPGEERVHEKNGSVLVYVPGGELTLGAKGLQAWTAPVHRVRLSPFWIGKFLVTNEQYSRFLAENRSCRKPAFWDDPRFNPPRHPVVGICWEEARDYCQWAGLALPSEAQWEAAARGTDRRPYPWGKTLPTPLHANFNGLRGSTTPVDLYPAGAGPYGTLDQAGNVWEWCADPWSSQAYQSLQDGELDPVAEGDKAVRSLRGGSWMNAAQDLYAAYRDRGTAKLRFNNQGLRCVLRPA
jgi:formylglycine-generating enzyme required for sulfatase activity